MQGVNAAQMDGGLIRICQTWAESEKLCETANPKLFSVTPEDNVMPAVKNVSLKICLATAGFLQEKGAGGILKLTDKFNLKKILLGFIRHVC